MDCEREGCVKRRRARKERQTQTESLKKNIHIQAKKKNVQVGTVSACVCEVDDWNSCDVMGRDGRWVALRRDRERC